jgi:transposase
MLFSGAEKEKSMRPRTPFSQRAKGELQRLMQQAKNVSEFRRIQCVWLRAALDMSVEAIAEATGLAHASIRCYHSRYMKKGKAALLGPGRGGRRNENLSVEEESALLARFAAKAESGGVLEVSEIKRAYEQTIGRQVPKSTIYRVLSRQGWRKIAPRPHHPKQDPKRRSEFKKNFPNASRAK